MGYLYRNEPYPDSEKEALAVRNVELQGDLDLANIRLTEQTGLRVNAQNDLSNFKKRVVDVALEYAKSNDWCGEVVEALQDLGLKDLIPNTVKTVKMTIQMDVEGELGWDDDEYQDAAWEDIRSAEILDYEVRDTR